MIAFPSSRTSLAAAVLLAGCLAPAAIPAASAASSSSSHSRIVVQVHSNEGLDTLTRSLAALGWRISGSRGKVYTATPCDTGAASVDLTVSALAGVTDVRAAQIEGEFLADNPFDGGQSQAPVFSDDLILASMASQPAMVLVGANKMPALPSGSAVTVAVLDGGFDVGHEALAGALAGGYDAVDGDTNPNDPGNGVDDDGDGDVDGGLGHGTAVAGLLWTLAPTSRVLFVRVLDDEGVGSVSSVAAGLQWALESGASVINISATAPLSSPMIDGLLLEAWTRGVQVVVCAGNGGVDTLGYPATSPYVTAVTGVRTDRTIDPNANYGVETDIGAPSVSIVAPSPRGPNKYAYWTGTSFAAPFVSAAAVRVLASRLAAPTEIESVLVDETISYKRVSSTMTGEVGEGILDLNQLGK